MRKKNNIFALGIYSILKKTENVFHLMIILAISFTLLSIGVIYTRYIDFAYNNTLKEYEEDVMLFADVPDNYDSGEIQKIKNYLKDKKSISDIRIYSVVDVFSFIGKDKLSSIKDGKIKLSIDNQIYKSNSYDRLFSVNIGYDNTKLIPDYYNEICREMCGEDLLRYGKYPENSDEILINEKLLFSFGINESEVSDICGKKINIMFDDVDVITEKIIAGVVREEYTEISGVNYSDVLYSESLDDDFLPYTLFEIQTNYYDRYELDTVKNEVYNNFYLNFEGNHMCSVLDFLFDQNKITNKIIYVIMFVILICSLLNIIIFLSTLLFQNRRQIALFMSQGFTVQEIIKLKLIETIGSTLGAVLLSTLFITISVNIFNSYICDFFIIEREIPFYIAVGSVVGVVLTVCVVIILLYICTINVFVSKNSVNEMLKY